MKILLMGGPRHGQIWTLDNVVGSIEGNVLEHPDEPRGRYVPIPTRLSPGVDFDGPEYAAEWQQYPTNP